MPAGTVASLHRWPVKSLAGEDAGALWLDRRGVAGDRAHALYDVFKDEPRRLTVRQAPGMLRWRAAYADAPDDALRPDDVPLPIVTGPGGERWEWGAPGLAEALSDDLGRAVTLRRDASLMQDLDDSVLITTQATLDAVGAALGDGALDLRRFRTNVHLVLDDDVPAFAENDWEGRTLTVGDVTLDLLHPCARCVIPTRDPDTTEKDPNILKWLTRHREGCFGINARMRDGGSGRIAVGDPVVAR